MTREIVVTKGRRYLVTAPESPSLQARMEAEQVWVPKHAHWSWRGSFSPSPAQGTTTRWTPCHTQALSLAGHNVDGLHIEVGKEG